MIVWRITRKRFLDEALSGEGASRYPGRWNHRDTPMVYAASHASLAVLEYLANLDIATLPNDLVLLTLAIPDDVAQFERMPEGWDARPPIAATRDLGTEWIQSRRTIALSVPSVILPSENNILLNPLHPDIGKVGVSPPFDFHFDPRLIKSPT